MVSLLLSVKKEMVPPSSDTFRNLIGKKSSTWVDVPTVFFRDCMEVQPDRESVLCQCTLIRYKHRWKGHLN